jgi:hypothetical protein
VTQWEYGYTQPKKEELQKKSRYSDRFLIVVAPNTTETAPKVCFFKTEAFKKKIVNKRRHRTITDLRFSR